MNLKRFKVTDFRSVKDSGWIELDQVTALIGINESGKTNLLLPLWKLNPAREGEIKPTSDYPKSNYAAVRADPQDFDFITAEFDAPELADDLAEKTGISSRFLDYVSVSRDYNGSYHVSFPNYSHPTGISSAVIKDDIKVCVEDLTKIPALVKEATSKPEMLHALSIAMEGLGSDEILSSGRLEQLLAELKNGIPQFSAPSSSLVPRYRTLIEAIEAHRLALDIVSPADNAEVVGLVAGRLPRFVYYSNYGNLDSEIYLPHVVDNLLRGDLGAREAAKARTLRVLFSFVRLQPNEISELGRDFRSTPNRAPTADEIAEIATKKTRADYTS